jgi:hypothetical protein
MESIITPAATQEQEGEDTAAPNSLEQSSMVPVLEALKRDLEYVMTTSRETAAEIQSMKDSIFNETMEHMHIKHFASQYVRRPDVTDEERKKQFRQYLKKTQDYMHQREVQFIAVEHETNNKFMDTKRTADACALSLSTIVQQIEIAKNGGRVDLKTLQRELPLPPSQRR